MEGETLDGDISGQVIGVVLYFLGALFFGDAWFPVGM